MNLDQARDQILIVDDDPATVVVLDDALYNEEFDVVVANDAETGIALAQREHVDLILLDVSLPGLDGFEVCRRLKAGSATVHIPVMFMTSFDNKRHRLHAFDAGGVDYISKPFDLPELLARIRTQLSIRRLTKALETQNTALRNEIRERADAEAQRERLTAALKEAKERIERELVEREHAEADRARLQEQVISAQRERLRELSTPIVPIMDHIVAMPLIGAMDAERAAHVLETALEGTAARGARFVILDITGIRDVNAQVADVLVRVAMGLKLLGASAVLTGVSPQVARLFVQLNTSLDSLVTKPTFQDGIAHAIRSSSHRR